MKAVAVPQLNAALTTMEQPSRAARLRHAAAHFWLNCFFWNVQHLPHLTRWSKRLLIWPAFLSVVLGLALIGFGLWFTLQGAGQGTGV